MNSGKFIGKRLLVLGSNIYAPEIVDYARENGAYVFVADYYPPEKSAAKRHADEAVDISTADIDALKSFCLSHKIDGVFSGISEFNILSAMQLSKELGLRFYCNKSQWDRVERKDNFRKLCQTHKVPCPEEYYSGPSANLTEAIKSSILYPAVVKPVDCAASTGVSFCYNRDELDKAVQEADSCSKSHSIIIEQYITGYEFTVHYTICKGKVALACIDNRYPVKVHEGNVTTIPAARVYPALFLDQYKASVNPQMISLCESLGVEFGILFAQGFYDPSNESFSIFEAGLRSAAECPCRFLESVTGQNHIHMLVDYILTGESDYDLNLEDPDLHGKTCGIISFTAIGGKVGRIDGLEETLSKMPNIIRFENRYPVGSIAPDGNTLRQLMLRFIMVCESREEMVKDIAYLNDHIHVYDTNGKNMVVKIVPERILGLE